MQKSAITPLNTLREELYHGRNYAILLRKITYLLPVSKCYTLQMKKSICFTFILTLFSLNTAGAIPAFPGAEGHGAVATGGRGGVVYEVTNLNDSGPGSLRDALNHNIARTIVFRVSGTIHLNSKLNLYYGNVTIAGQTAPGDGICIANGTLYAGYTNVIIRYIRCRLGDCWPDGTENEDADATWGRYGDRIILDHVTASWSIDETFSYYVNTNFTAQWCMVSESLYNSHHEKGNHGYGGIWGSTNSSWHHNLLAHHTSRNPRIDGEITNNVDLRNNVIYNWGGNSCYGGEKATVNIVNCYYKYGPATGSSVKDRIVQPSLRKDDNGDVIVPHVYGQWYVNGNYVYGYPAITSNNYYGVDPDGGSSERPLCVTFTPFPVATTYPVTEQSAENAYYYVLRDVGCSLTRDSIDTRIINEVSTGTATYGGYYGANKGIIDSQTTVGGWPTLNSLTAPADSDHDGMPDQWELLHGLNPNDASDRNGDFTGDGYTNLEKYINSLCPDPYAPKPNPMDFAQAPFSNGAYSISMTAATASDVCGVEYYFANLTFTDGSHDSGWQDSAAYIDTDLDDGITYTYQVKTRNKSGNHNETIWSPESSATAARYICTSPIASDLDENCQVDFQDFAILSDQWIDDWLGILQFAEDWLVCNRSPIEECWQ